MSQPIRPGRAGPLRPRVALIVETSVVYGREIIEGVTEYVRAHRPWSVCGTARKCVGRAGEIHLRAQDVHAETDTPTCRAVLRLFGRCHLSRLGSQH